ncbi:hypothetical protein [Porphyrobacter sp. TH134]|uniref:hypothetical protein n=1 Tax=Porphyrobacter sp. TH134 TaxID=2067450 RepID=UPI00117D0C44|nr:hypothetical protein [Porphyrobacter sp. TH134]
MPVLPDFDALGLDKGMMFEKAKPRSAIQGAPGTGYPVEGRSHLSAAVAVSADDRFAGSAARRAGDALRAVEWSELTARLNAARDLRLLLRTESQAPIEAVAASFGDAAASYFALLDDSEPGINHTTLEQSKALDAMVGTSKANRHGDAAGFSSDAVRGAARDTQ